MVSLVAEATAEEDQLLPAEDSEHEIEKEDCAISSSGRAG